MKTLLLVHLVAVLAVIVGCTHIRIHDLDSSAPEQTVALKNRDVTAWVDHYADSAVDSIRFCNVLADEGSAVCDLAQPPENDRVLFSFVHLSDVQLYDERVVIVSRFVSRIFDNFVDSARLDPAQAKHDASVYLALVGAINQWNDNVCDANGSPTNQNPLFIAHTGDEIHADVYQEMWEFLNITYKLQLPWFPMIGNHDVMTFGTRPASKETVTTIDTDRPSLAMNIIRTPEEFMAFHSAGENAKLPPGLTVALPQHNPVSSACLPGTRDLRPEPAGNPFDNFDIDQSERAPFRDSPCFDWQNIQARFRESGERPGYHSWTSNSGDPRIPDSWADATAPRDMPLRLLFLNTSQDITFSSGGIREDQLIWVRCQLERAADNDEYVLAFGHHPLSTRFSEREAIGQRKKEYSEIAQKIVDAFADHEKFLGFFGGHTHRFSHDKICGRSGRCFYEVIAPSAVQEVPQGGLLVRVVAPDPAEANNAVLEVHPFLGPYVEQGYGDMRCDENDPDIGGQLPTLKDAALAGSKGTLRHRRCRKFDGEYKSELRKLETLKLETEVTLQ